MNLHAELPKLISYYELKKARYSFNLRHVSESLAQLTKKINQLLSDEQTLQTILNNKKLSGHITLSTLHEFQRAEAIIKRKMADIKVQIRTNLLKKEKLLSELGQLRRALRLYHFKVEKYLFLNKRVALQRLQKQNTIEELTIEELTHGQDK